MKTITKEQYERLTELISDVRSLNAIADRLTKLAEDITEDWDTNSHTFDVCNNDRCDVDDLLKRLEITVEPETENDGAGESGGLLNLSGQ